MEFNELVKLRRSCRAYTEEPVTRAQMDAIIEAGQWAPSPLNLQPFQFIAVTGEAGKAGIHKAGLAARQAVLDQKGPGWVKNYPMDFILECPLILVVVSDPGAGGLGGFFGQPHGAMAAASACIQNMMLMAENLGLSSLWFTFFDPENVKALLEIPTDLDVAGAVLVGTPKTQVKVPPRKAPAVHLETFTP